MGAMMGKMDMNFTMYMQGMNEMYDTGFTDAGGVIEGGDVADAGGEGGDVAGGGEGGLVRLARKRELFVVLIATSSATKNEQVEWCSGSSFKIEHAAHVDTAITLYITGIRG